MTTSEFRGQLNPTVGGTSYDELVVLFNQLADYAETLENPINTTKK